MNLPNKLTVLRMALVPVFVVLMLWDTLPMHLLWALVVFAAASLTDMLDGKIARARGLITTFGKLMDPLADKILVMSAMLCFVELSWAPAWAVIIILGREFLVTSLRLVAAGEGKVIAADWWGKVKTVTQMIWVIYSLLWMFISNEGFSTTMPPQMVAAGNGVMAVLLVASVVFTVLSGFNYCYKNREVFLSDL